MISTKINKSKHIDPPPVIQFTSFWASWQMLVNYWYTIVMGRLTRTFQVGAIRMRPVVGRVDPKGTSSFSRLVQWIRVGSGLGRFNTQPELAVPMGRSRLCFFASNEHSPPVHPNSFHPRVGFNSMKWIVWPTTNIKCRAKANFESLAHKSNVIYL